MSREDHVHEGEQVKCRNEYCFCSVGEDEAFCSERCRKSARSERPKYECKCDHDDCEEDDDD